ncbi:SET domain-containing protein-lysine N-methyltransferase [Sulfidibacter corallicola]|uniref:SET domain-containing protein-lysine N-methyltransferase n=1 Tax=Sulfidibacter corallicola TaxID=2818388 RepID=A0A8A4TMZ1_SULCO|nr:SET domain-containing protein-lysine N-methyltransferase [Sulfidibacter corallicola]QTD50288.1 SET domain-containing protein-lysine N-methyltransferase [Sulfidibacter corallicola]
MTHAVMPAKRSAMTRMLHWLKEGGCTFPHLAVQHRPGQNRGLFCRADLTEGKHMLMIPRTFMMCGDKANQSSIGREIARSGISLASRQSVLAAFMLAESARPDSFWKPYLDTLPKSFDEVPVCFDEDRLARLAGSFVLETVQARKRILEQDYAQLSASVSRFTFSFDAFVWAMTAINTRAFSVPSEDDEGKVPAMIPLLDMGNHAQSATSKWCYRSEPEGMTLEATGPLQAGEQVYLYYGTKTRARFFAGYGFVAADLEEAQSWVKVSLFTDDPQYDMKRELFGGEEACGFPLSSHEFDGLNRMLQAVHVILADLTDGRDVNALSNRGPIGLHHERVALHYAGSLCDRRLASFRESLEDHERRLEDWERCGTGDPRDVQILRMVVSEQRVLHQVRDFCRILESVIDTRIETGKKHPCPPAPARFDEETFRAWYARWDSERYDRCLDALALAHREEGIALDCGDLSLKPMTPAIWLAICKLSMPKVRGRNAANPMEHLARQCFSDTKMHYIAIYEGRQVIGWFAYATPSREQLDLEGIFLDKAHYGRGYEEIVLSKLCAAIGHYGPCATIRVDIGRDNPRVMATYLRKGFCLSKQPTSDESHWAFAYRQPA